MLLAVLAACTSPEPRLRQAPQGFAPLDLPGSSSSLPGDPTGESSGTGTTSSGSTPSTPSTSGSTTTTPTTTTTTTPTTDGTTSGPPPAPEACYPGPDDAYDVCLPVVEVDPVPSDYVYPAPLGGDPQYSAPIRYLDLDALDPGEALAANFVLEEFAQAYKGQWGVVQVHAVASIQAMRDDLGPLVVNSGYRSPAWNASIGGATWSRHMYGDAFDLDPVDVSLDALVDGCNDHDASYVELYETHVHCDWRDDPLDVAFYPASARVSFARMATAPLPVHAAEITADDGGLFEAPAEGWDEGEPLRVWTAYDASGARLARVTARTFAPPPDAAWVEVVVGGEVALRADVDRAPAPRDRRTP